MTFLIWNAFGMGGTIRTVLRQAGALAAAGRDVTVVSVVRVAGQEEPFLDWPAGVRCEVLVDRHAPAAHGPRAWLRRRLDRLPALSTQLALGREQHASLLTELVLIRRVLAARGVVVGTRVGLNIAIGRFGHPAATLVAQEHLRLTGYAPATRRVLARYVPRLDVVATLTEAEAAAYRRMLATAAPDGTGPRVVVVPNAIDDRLPDRADPAAPCIVAVGRLAPGKRLHLLVEAFARIADRHPAWRLRIVGAGGQRQRILDAATELGVADRVELVGAVADVDAELLTGSVFGMTSRFESFGIVALEAMAAGLAVVAFDVPRGPRELLSDGRTALLVPNSDVTTFAERLDDVLSDQALRGRLGTAARREAHRYRLTPVTDRWLQVLDEASAPRGERMPLGVG